VIFFLKDIGNTGNLLLIAFHIISCEEIESVDLAMKDFLIKIKSAFGPEIATPNMHMHLHLKDCLLDYGPLYSFWCFPFKRLNG